MFFVFQSEILQQVFSDLCVLFFEVESLFHGSDFLLEMGQFADMVLFAQMAMEVAQC